MKSLYHLKQKNIKMFTISTELSLFFKENLIKRKLCKKYLQMTTFAMFASKKSWQMSRFHNFASQ